MQRILIIGSCGSGKTTLARKLSASLQLPLVHLDALYWRDDWEHVSQEEFDTLLLKELMNTKWILDGNFNRTLPQRLDYCDTVVYLDFPRAMCLFGVVKRVVKGYGKSRPDMGGNCPERFDIEFLRFVWNFNRNHRKRYYDLLSSTDKVETIILRSRRQVREFLKRVEA